MLTGLPLLFVGYSHIKDKGVGSIPKQASMLKYTRGGTGLIVHFAQGTGLKRVVGHITQKKCERWDAVIARCCHGSAGARQRSSFSAAQSQRGAAKMTSRSAGNVSRNPPDVVRRRGLAAPVTPLHPDLCQETGTTTSHPPPPRAARPRR